ncbi:MAG TPA: DUF421 domain-containing protein [Symbiobacteriaceae bacterium]
MNLGWVVAIRGVISFITLLVFTNILGKQQVGKLTFFDFITGITIGDLAATLTVDFDSRAWPHFVGLTIWTGLALIAQYVALKSRWWARITGGEPVILIQSGHILEKNMAQCRYRFDDLLMQLREKNVFDVQEVEAAVLETNGTLSVLKRSQFQPVTPNDLHLTTQYKGLGTMLIHEGNVLGGELKQVHLTKEWLADELHIQGIMSTKEVALAILGTDGKLFVDLYRDQVPDIPVDDQLLSH